MRREYITGFVAFLLAAAASLASPCPPALTAVAHEVAELRHVTGGFAPPCRSVSEAGLRRGLEHKLRRDLPVAPELYLEALRRSGFIDEVPATVYPRLLDFYTAQVLGYYEPESDEMVLVQRPQASEQETRTVWAHELDHAAQEHRFGLPSRLLAMRTDGDAQRAASAVAEGEAMLVMLVLNGAGSGIGALDSAQRSVARQAEALPRPEGVPTYFVADLVFPYTVGFRFVLDAYSKGGWPAVDTLLAHPPPTTAALLHPDRQQTRPELGDGALPAVPAGYEQVVSDTAGEWGLAFWLGRDLAHDEAARIAAGWDGDRLRLVRSTANHDRWALAWRLRCRDDRDLASLQAALRRLAPARLARLGPSAAPPRLQWRVSGGEIELRADWP
ncbi:MAG: DUF6782 family putative metallopeptidase [Acidobacteriota bacterium]